MKQLILFMGPYKTVIIPDWPQGNIYTCQGQHNNSMSTHTHFYQHTQATVQNVQGLTSNKPTARKQILLIGYNIIGDN